MLSFFIISLGKSSKSIAETKEVPKNVGLIIEKHKRDIKFSTTDSIGKFHLVRRTF